MTTYDKVSKLLSNSAQVLGEGAPEQVCGCSTCKEAMDAGIRLAAQLSEHQCAFYITQIGTVLLNFAKTYGMVQDITGNEANLGRPLTEDELIYILQDNIQDNETRQYLFGKTLAKETEHMFNACDAALAKNSGTHH